MNINFNTLQKKLMPFIFMALIAYCLSFTIFIYLPKSGVEFNGENSVDLEFKNYSGFYLLTEASSFKESKKEVKSFEKISKYELKAIYSTTSNEGWVILEDKLKKETHIISYNEDFNGYILKSLYKEFVLFVKDSKEYKMELKKEKLVDFSINNNSTNESIIVEDGKVTIKKDFFNSYVNDIEKIWKDISITEYKKDNRFEGFKVTRVNDNSVITKLGLKQGDIIKSINNKELKSYNDVFKLYKNINKIGYLSMEVLRENEIVELNYEIN